MKDFLTAEDPWALITLLESCLSQTIYLFCKDTQSHYTACNEAFAKLVNLDSVESIVHMTDDELPWSVHAPFFQEGDAQALKGQPVIDQEETLTLRDRAPIIVSVTKKPIHNASGAMTGVIGIARDITLYKQREEALREEKRQIQRFHHDRDLFLKNFAHDLRTPLAGIIGLTESFQQEEKQVRIKEKLPLVLKAIKAFLYRVDEIIHLLNLDDPTEKTGFSPSHFIQQLYDFFAPLARQKGLSLYFEKTGPLPHQWITHHFGLQKICTCLISNAIHFTKQGSIRVDFQWQSCHAQEGELIITVQDTGIGIATAYHEAIFQPFFRLQPSYQKGTEGVGVGLPLAKKYLDQMGGTIHLESESEKGSTFKARLSIEYANQPVPSKKERPLKQSRGDGLKVLIVEDDPLAQAGIVQMLQSIGCKVDVANHSEEALGKLKKNTYDLIITDLGLPKVIGTLDSGLQGTELAVEIQKTCSTPIMALTAHFNEAVESECLKSGIKAVFKKPLNERAINIILSIKGRPS